MKNISLIAMLLAVFPLTAAANTVSKITRSVSITEGEQRYAQITVTCKNTEKTAHIRKDQGALLWCVDGQNKKCSSQKVKAAKLACRSSEVLVDSASTKTNSVKVEPTALKHAQAERDRFELEAELINIKQKELDLRRRTLEIQKRKLVRQN